MKRLVVLAAVLLLAGCSSSGGAASSTQGQIVFSQASYSCASNVMSGSSGQKTKWSADLSARIGGTAVTSIVAKKVPGGESVVDDVNVPMSNPDANTISAPGIDVGVACLDPKWGQGDYVMRIIRPSDSMVLAEGAFALAP